MYSLLKKEISSFFNGITGYIVVILFLTINGLFIWVFPGEMNILDSGYSTLDPMFIISPWVFLFLVPAITMRMFSEEKRTGTMELLLTKPITDIQLILAKYFAAVILILISLLPCLIYFLSVYILGNPVGNLDIGGTWGSFIGLFFLAGVYASIGIFSSALTANQIVTFLIAVVLSFLLLAGFDMLATLTFFEKVAGILVNLGINDHYYAMSRGVIDSRDLIYFFSMIIFFVFTTKFILRHKLNNG